MIWFLDIETTGLDPFKDRILEIYICNLELSISNNYIINLPLSYELSNDIKTMHHELLPLCYSSELQVQDVIAELDNLIKPNDIIIGKNIAKFDYLFLLNNNFPYTKYVNLFDVAHIFYEHGKTWPTLAQCCREANITPNITHRAKNEALITRELYIMYFDL